MSAFFASRRGHSETETPEPVKVMPTGQPVGFDSVIGANSQTEGTFFSSGNVRMDGKFVGALEIEGNILIGESADIRADIIARNISIAGTVRGNVTGDKVQLLRTGRIWGDISASALTTEEGAFIEGKITMVGHSALSVGADDETGEGQVGANLLVDVGNEQVDGIDELSDDDMTAGEAADSETAKAS